MARPIDASIAMKKIREYMENFPNANTRLATCRAILSMLGGTVSYCVTMALGIEVMHLHQIVIGMAVSLVLMVIGSKIGKPSSPEVLKEYF